MNFNVHFRFYLFLECCLVKLFFLHIYLFTTPIWFNFLNSYLLQAFLGFFLVLHLVLLVIDSSRKIWTCFFLVCLTLSIILLLRCANRVSEMRSDGGCVHVRRFVRGRRKNRIKKTYLRISAKILPELYFCTNTYVRVRKIFHTDAMILVEFYR